MDGDDDNGDMKYTEHIWPIKGEDGMVRQMITLWPRKNCNTTYSMRSGNVEYTQVGYSRGFDLAPFPTIEPVPVSASTLTEDDRATVRAAMEFDDSKSEERSEEDGDTQIDTIVPDDINVDYDEVD